MHAGSLLKCLSSSAPSARGFYDPNSESSGGERDVVIPSARIPGETRIFQLALVRARRKMFSPIVFVATIHGSWQKITNATARGRRGRGGAGPRIEKKALFSKV